MPWTSQHTPFCRSCGRAREDAETFSRRGKCPECGDGHMIANSRQLRAHDGPWFQHWRRRCVAAFGAVLVEELEREE